MTDSKRSQHRHASSSTHLPIGVMRNGGVVRDGAMRTPHLVEIQNSELSAISGGDWEDTMWGFMLGTAVTAGFLGSGGLLLLAAAAGGVILLDDYVAG